MTTTTVMVAGNLDPLLCLINQRVRRRPAAVKTQFNASSIILEE
jgi:hypothetical protein